MLPTRSRPPSTRRLASWDCPSPPTSPRAGPSEPGCCAAKGRWSPSAISLLPPTGETGIRALARAGAIGPETVAAHCVDLEPDEIELLASLRRRSRSLPAFQRLPRLWLRAARGSARGWRSRGDRYRQPGLDSILRHVRRASFRGRLRARARAKAAGAEGGSRRSSSRRSAPPGRSGSRARSVRSFPVSARISLS